MTTSSNEKLATPDRFVDRLRKKVAECPDLCAVETRDSEGRVTSLSYHELWQRSGAVALVIAERFGNSHRQASPVAIHVEKSANFLIALVGCWRARVAAAILDPEWPKARLQLIRDNVAPQLTLDREAIETAIAQFPPSAQPPDVASEEQIAPDDLAYIIYTSGSTGEPKGVAVPHSGLTNLLEQQISAFRLHPGHRSLWMHHVAFDASISDIGTALLSGATLCIARHLESASARQLLLAVDKMEITHVDLPPALLGFLDPGNRPPTLKTIIIGGDVCSVETVRQWSSAVRLVIVYGPTEATICTSIVVADQNWDAACIGEAISGIKYRIDSRHSPGPDASEGELLISGIGLADRYLNNADLTAQRFPIIDGQRWFRSGDLVRRHCQAGYEFLGRVDRQFKLNGRLVCPEEIEAAILQAADVTAAAVVRRQGSSRAYLLAWAETAAKSSEILSSIRRSISERLPAWMIPPTIFLQDQLPKLANGKIDYQNLAANQDTTTLMPEPTNSTAPESLAARIAAAMNFVLDGGGDITEDEDFFAGGGDSLALLLLLSEAERRGIPLSAEVVKRERTPAKISKYLSANDISNTAMGIDKLREHLTNWHPSPHTGTLPKSPTSAGSLLITGATGFLGSALVAELLQSTNIFPLHCLVRGEAAGEKFRITSSLKKHGYQPSAEDLRRIVCISGHLDTEQFGWTDEEWQRRRDATLSVLHCAADVRLTASFDELAAANIGGTRTVLDFASSADRKIAVHYISTLSVFVDAAPAREICCEADPADSPSEVYGGYAQTKWVAEQHFLDAARNGWPVTIYRCGLLTANSKTGFAPSNDLLGMFLSSEWSEENMETTASPADLALDFTPVDYAAKAISHIMTHSPMAVCPSSNEKPVLPVFHICNSRPVLRRDLIAAIVQSRVGTAIPATIDHHPRFALADVRHSDNSSRTLHRPFDLFKATGTSFSTENTERALRGSGIACPPQTIERLVEHLRKMQQTAPC